MGSLFENPEFWVLVAFVIFLALVSRRVFRTITRMLDARAEQVKDELEAATRLREEAQNLLARHQRRQRDVEREVEAMLAEARRDAELLVGEAKVRLGEQLTRRREIAKQTIARAEAEAVGEIRGLTVDLAIAAAERLVSEHLDEARAAALIDDSIAELGRKLS